MFWQPGSRIAGEQRRFSGRFTADSLLTPNDVEIAPLGVPGEASDGETLLAGRFPEELTDQVGSLVNEAGGEIVVDADEAWTR